MNAKDEFTEHIDNRAVKCALIEKVTGFCTPASSSPLREGYSSEEYASFLDSIDFPYDNGFGSQKLFGIIWYNDGTWSERGEYDGSEWWAHKTSPEIPSVLRRE